MAGELLIFVIYSDFGGQCMVMLKDEIHIPHAYIYIAFDVRDFTISKVGLTTSAEPLKRIKSGQTSNPYYLPFCMFNIGVAGTGALELKAFEGFLHNKLGVRIELGLNGGLSEWIRISPPCAVEEIEGFIANGFRLQGESFWNEDGEIEESMMAGLRKPVFYSYGEIVDRFGSSACKFFLRYLRQGGRGGESIK